MSFVLLRSRLGFTFLLLLDRAGPGSSEAGELEPRRVRARDVRLIKPIYPPWAQFTWVLTANPGAVVRQGDENLSDTAFHLTGSFNLSRGRLFHEKQMLDHWMRRALR